MMPWDRRSGDVSSAMPWDERSGDVFAVVPWDRTQRAGGLNVDWAGLSARLASVR